MQNLVVATIVIAASTLTASAQGVRCSAFLHERGGSWRSFEPGAILGPRGPIPVRTGQRFRRGAPSGSDYIARVLDAQCQPD